MISDSEDKILAEVYSILINTGRPSAIRYLVEKTGLSAEDAEKYVGQLGEEGRVNKDELELKLQSGFNPDGSMTAQSILSVVKDLKPGNKIHLEYKPFLGKLRVYDTEYRNISVEMLSSKYFSMQCSEKDFQSLMDDVADELFDYMHLYFFCSDNNSEIDCRLSRITVLRKQ